MNAPSKVKLDNVEKATVAWGNPPDWVIVLAEACNMSTQAAVARQLDYSPAVVSSVLSNSYQKGDIASFEQVVRTELMAETVMCPRQGEITRKLCLDWQKKPFDTTSANRVRMYQACRNGCPNSRLSREETSHAE